MPFDINILKTNFNFNLPFSLVHLTQNENFYAIVFVPLLKSHYIKTGNAGSKNIFVCRMKLSYKRK